MSSSLPAQLQHGCKWDIAAQVTKAGIFFASLTACKEAVTTQRSYCHLPAITLALCMSAPR